MPPTEVRLSTAYRFGEAAFARGATRRDNPYRDEMESWAWDLAYRLSEHIARYRS